MAQTIKLKRSATTGNAPTASQLALGELGINTTDGKLFLKKSVSGTESIVEVGGLPLSGGTLTGNLSLGTNNKAIFNSQLEIYGDGSHSYISDVGTGNLIIKGTHLNLRDANNTLYMEALQGGAVTLRHAGNISVATTSTGIDVTGSVVADGVQSTDGNIKVTTLGSFVGFNSQRAGVPSSGGYQLGRLNFDAYSTGTTFVSGASIQSYSDGAAWTSSSTPAYLSFQTTPSGSTSLKERIKVANNGDISFYNDSAAQGLFWDSSTSRLGLGVTNPAVPLHVSGTVRADIVSVQSELFLGSSSMGKLTQSGSNWVFNTYASGAFGERFRIKDTGVDVSGSVTAPTLIAGAYGASGSAGDGFRINSTDLYGQTDSSDKIHLSAVSGNATFSGSVTSTGLTSNADATISTSGFTRLNINSTRTSGNIGGVEFKASGVIKGQIFGTVAGGIKLSSNGSTEALTINSSQNVNIPNGGLMVGSTTAPSDKIEIFTTDTNSGLNLVANNGSNQNSHSPKLKFNGEYQSNGPFIQGLNTGAVGYKALVFNTVRTDNDYTTLPAESMRIDSSGNVGIGIDSPFFTNATRKTLSINGTGSSNLSFGANGTAYGNIFVASNEMNIGTQTSANPLKFVIGGSEAARIDASQNLLVGRTSASGVDTDGHVLFGNGVSYQSNTDNAAQFVNRNGTDGSITSFYKNGTAVGSIGSDSNSQFMIGSGDTGLTFQSNTDAIIPRNTDGTARTQLINLGTSGAQFKDLYLSNKAYANYIGSSGDTNTNIYFPTGDQIRFITGGNERARIDASGRVLVGKSSPTISTTGVELRPNGQVFATQSGNYPLLLNRTTSDGDIIQLRKDNTTVGSIGTASSVMYFGSGDVALRTNPIGDAVEPFNTTNTNVRDALIDLGSSAARFKDLYLSNNATAQKLTLTKDPVGTYTIEVDGTNTGQPNLIVKQSTSERLRIDNLGRVGIGTSNPYGLMHCQDSSTINLIGTNSGADGQTDTTVLSLIGQARGYNNNLPKLASIDFKTDPTTWYKGNITFNVANSDGTDPSLTPLEAMRIFSDGDVSIGMTYNYAKLNVNGDIRAENSKFLAGRENASAPAFAFHDDHDTGIFNINPNILGFATGGQEAARIDASQNLLVGTTDSTPYNNNAGSTADNGIVLSEAGWLAAARYQGTVAFLNRTDNDGDIAVFRRDGTTVGSIGSLSGTQIVIDSGGNRSGVRFEDNGLLPRKNSAMADGTVTLGNPSYKFSDLYLSGTANVQYAGATDTGIYFNGSFNAVVPYRPDTGVAVDDYLDLGVYSHRWDDIFATNGTIQTSDRNEKQDIESLTEAEERVAVAAKGLLKKFRWKSAVEDKGDDARIHFGIIAQDLQDAFEAEGLDAGRYGMFTSNTWTNEDGEEQTRMGVRYSELLAFIISAI